MEKKKRFLLIETLFALTASYHTVIGLNTAPLPQAISKGIPILILLAGVLTAPKPEIRIVLALIFSYLGDMSSELIMDNDFPFLSQMFFFSCAQLFYILEFSRSEKAEGKNFSFVPFFMVPYAGLLLGMVGCACFCKRGRSRKRILGALLFLLSDSLILVRMLSNGFPLDNQLVIATYYFAQWCLCLPYMQSRS